MASTAAKPPLSSHPAFRWLVALWFAALVGGGLFVMPAQTHAFLLAQTGLALPEGLDPRLAIALAGAVLGFLLGLLIAGRAGRRADDEAEAWDAAEPDADNALAPQDEADWEKPQGAATGRRRLFNPREDLGEDGIAAPELPVEEAEFVEIEADDAPAGMTSFAHLDDAEWGEPVDDAGFDEAGHGWDEAPPEPAVHAAPTIEPDAIADLSLSELTARLGRALAAAGGASTPLRPAAEALPAAPPADETPAGEGEDALRSALERLSRVRRGE